ncbi:pentatricopeptide repeat-containing protein At1g80880, mitochondrial-like [Salvia splendens]|uniref:pentatricopeptide repeat-containing protein At1g80880, mitochondrial-like n=1 Tax=Salvia splendens TaxID=180675 RepID=UPI0011029A7B|nr:pentatricopeptide repeat-containing protein At1g80880, mitochondrial-like [Salvia splendens]
MASLLLVVRRLQFHTLRPISCTSLISRSIPAKLPPFFTQAFHQAPCKRCKHTPHAGSLLQTHSQSIYRITDFLEYAHEIPERAQLGLPEFLERVQNAKDIASGDEAMALLDDSGVKPDKDFIFSAIWALREEWKLAFLVFKWGMKWDCVVNKIWCLMIWLLGNHSKFSTAWTVVHELYRGSKDARQAILIMIDRYAAANQPDKAIETFHFMQKFTFSLERKTYFTFLNILCTHGNIEEAEEFMFLNKKFFPLETESFNIILYGWCNITVDIYEAKRVWREMSKCCIEPDWTSYIHMISGYSRVHNLYDSLRLYDEMKRRGWAPGLEVYHSLIYVLTHENCLTEALKLVDRMKESGPVPDSTTYNLIIRPLCENARFEDARSVLARMLGDGISPTIDTYHELLKGENSEGALGVLDRMNKAGLGPNHDTFTCMLDEYFKSGEPDDALKIWSAMKVYEVKPDRSLYGIMVEGLTKCGLTDKAREFYSEMKSSGLENDLSLRKLVEQPSPGQCKGKMKVVRRIKRCKGLRHGGSKKRNHNKQ